MRSAERGISALVMPLALTAVLLVFALAFGGWAYSQMLNYKNNADALVSTAVDKAKQDEAATKDAEFAEVQKSPLATYVGPTTYGSVVIKYPKSWSAYISDKTNSSPFIDAYFYPAVVPSTQGSDSVFALRVQVVQDTYSNVINQFNGNVQNGTLKAVPFAAPKVPKVVGVKVLGQLPNNKNGAMVVLPMRNMTLELWTESPDFQKDFDKYILPNFSFAP